jgi:nitroimidazol reductase NimA-like FMN-containing flavoprotein (pyridoxamine 5'-phosphate oxidase superfamily)
VQIRQLSADECREALKTTNLGRLGCVRYNQPYVVPIYFDFFDDGLYSFATIGQKIHWMRTNPRVCVEVDDIIDQFNWTTVLVNGRYEELTRAAAFKSARERAGRLFEKRPDWWYPAAAKLSSKDTRTPVIYRINVEIVSGRRAVRDAARITRVKRPAASQAPHWWNRVLHPLLHRPSAID